MINATIEKFGCPATLVREYQHWLVLLRPAQVTLGSLVLAAKSSVTAYGKLDGSAFSEQARVVADIEHALTAFCSYEKINYLMLMMVDPHVHFHVIPRYQGQREWKGLVLPDSGWPGAPDLKSATVLSDDQLKELSAALSDAWPVS
jgi:diadenosine tetraphosphate (Ap4A) HIT family hydrolase